MRIVNAADPFSINDLGCGYGALLDYLDARGFKTDYTGIDVSPEMVRAAALRFEGRANADFICAARIDREADYSVASGIFNVRLKSLDTEWCAHIEATLDMLNEPPRHVRRLQFLERMGSCQVVHRGGTRRSCVSGRCGWSQRSAVSTIRSGQRSVRSPVYLVLAARRRCVSGCARRRSMPAHGPGPRPKNPLS
ncbi:class I SAM-dependent methyltransferase [Mycobacterium tuberculosis]|nr:class I SAM-dependent methyltransferase [Mycobacterium tuberculosis]QON86034.1 class I SAM-dependent methyltransferase [Mycobacterium tuberculosis]QON90191.1 class I SAM-dependent methyltransferase [Mycobacterium tuberculosis]QON94345.1 class I SAM-dependent methyltransferase [Mycobacterium tuberculosis]